MSQVSWLWQEDWRGDFDNATVAPFGWDDSEIPDPTLSPGRLSLDQVTTRRGLGNSLRVEVRDNEQAYANNGDTHLQPEPGERAEVALTKPSHLDSAGDVRRYEWSTYFDLNFPGKNGNFPRWQVFAQWHPDPTQKYGDKTPTLQLHVNDATTMKLMLTDSFGATTEEKIGDMNRGSWHDFIVEVRWSETSSGYVRITVDGISPPVFYGPTLYPGNPTVYFKLGLYREKGSGVGTAILYHDEAHRLRPTLIFKFVRGIFWSFIRSIRYP